MLTIRLWLPADPSINAACPVQRGGGGWQVWGMQPLPCQPHGQAEVIRAFPLQAQDGQAVFRPDLT